MYPSDNGYFNLLHAGVRQREAQERSADEQSRAEADAERDVRAERAAARQRMLARLGDDDA